MKLCILEECLFLVIKVEAALAFYEFLIASAGEIAQSRGIRTRSCWKGDGAADFALFLCDFCVVVGAKISSGWRPIAPRSEAIAPRL